MLPQIEKDKIYSRIMSTMYSKNLIFLARLLEAALYFVFYIVNFNMFLVIV